MHRRMLPAAIGLRLASRLHAQTLMPSKHGEQTTSMTEQCFHSALGSEYTLTRLGRSSCARSLFKCLHSLPQRPPSLSKGAASSL